MKLTFHGGAGSVTGAQYLLESREGKVLVDCGLEQGSAYTEESNFAPFSFSPAELDALFVTHAHIDHIGRIPQLVQSGFSGAIHSTAPTREFARELLLDAFHLMEREAERSGGKLLYDESAIERTFELWQTTSYETPLSVRDLRVVFHNAGHIVGSSSISISGPGEGGVEKTVLFSGDLGNSSPSLITPPSPIIGADYVLIESTYGNRRHERLDTRREDLEDIIEETIAAGGVLMIPAFAMERTQELLFEINDLVEEGRIPRIPIFVDSPLAIRLTEVYRRFADEAEYLDPEAIARFRGSGELFEFPGLTLAVSVEESKAINTVPAPKIVIAGSGMSNGGRILHHEISYLSDPASTLLFIGYQAAGSLGRRLQSGEKSVRILGQEVSVSARIASVSGYSAHADQPHLVSWLRPMRFGLATVFVVQGDEEASAELAHVVQDELAVATRVPSRGETVLL